MRASGSSQQMDLIAPKLYTSYGTSLIQILAGSSESAAGGVGGARWGEGASSFVARLGRLTVDHSSVPRRSTVQTYQVYMKNKHVSVQSGLCPTVANRRNLHILVFS